MTYTTEDFEYLLDLENVRAVEWTGERLLVRVSKKLPDAEIADADNIGLVLKEGVEFDVIDEGDEPGKNEYDLLPLAEPESTDPSEHQQRHRPITGGVSEIHYDSTAATAGQFAAEVVDTSKGKWADTAKEGDIVRTSNNHVYAKINEADFGDEIIQPSPMDGGEKPDDVSGRLVGYVPLEDGTRVDIAARSADEDEDVAFGIDEGYGHDVFRGNFEDLRGDKTTKSGRTTGVTVGEIENVSASVNVGLPDGSVKVRDVCITGKMGDGGDSGSPWFHRETGALLGTLFAGGPTSTIFCKAKNIEEDLGVEYLPNDNAPPTDRPEGEPGMCIWIRKLLPAGIADVICRLIGGA